ncbi:MAG: hypothetical protein ABIA63_03040 [bacterium]
MAITKVGNRFYRLDVEVWRVGRKRETFTGTLHQARERISEIKKEIRAKAGKDDSLKFKTFAQVLDYYRE